MCGVHMCERRTCVVTEANLAAAVSIAIIQIVLGILVVRGGHSCAVLLHRRHRLEFLFPVLRWAAYTSSPNRRVERMRAAPDQLRAGVRPYIGRRSFLAANDGTFWCPRIQVWSHNLKSNPRCEWSPPSVIGEVGCWSHAACLGRAVANPAVVFRVCECFDMFIYVRTDLSLLASCCLSCAQFIRTFVRLRCDFYAASPQHRLALCNFDIISTFVSRRLDVGSTHSRAAICNYDLLPKLENHAAVADSMQLRCRSNALSPSTVYPARSRC